MLGKWAVISSGSTVETIRAAVPIQNGAAASRARRTITITLLRGSQLCKLGLLCVNWTVIKSGSTVQVIRTAFPSNHGAAASRAGAAITLLRCSHLF